MDAVGIYQVYDTVAEQAVGPLMTYVNDAAAVRDFTIATRKNSDMKDDLRILKLGVYHMDTLEIELHDEPQLLVEGRMVDAKSSTV